MRDLRLFGFTALCALSLVIGLVPPLARGGDAEQAAFRLVDMANVAHALPAAPQRFVLTANIMPLYATLAQGLEGLVGATDLGRSGMSPPLLDRIFPGVERIAPVAGDLKPSFEQILRLRPDAVIGWAAQSDVLGVTGYPDFIRVATRVPQTPGHLELWRLLAKVTGREERSRLLLASYKRKLDALAQRRATAPEKPVRVMMLVANASNQWIGGTKYILNERLAAAGAENVIHGPIAAKLSMEDVAALDPDAIIIHSIAPEPTPAALMAEPVWRMIRAVREGRVYREPDWPIFLVPVFDPLVVEWLLELLHPRLAVNLRDSLKAAYADAYGYALSEDEIDELLAIVDNRVSLGYARFAARAVGG